MDKSTACQHALALLGEINFKQHTAPNSICHTLYTDVVRYANNAAHWSFARTHRTLQPLSSSPSPTGIRAYRIPADCLKIISLTNTNTGKKIPHWQIYSGIIEIDTPAADTITITYTSDLLSAQADLPDQAPDFCQYIIHLLAARLAPTITGQLELATHFEQKAALLLAQAIYADARQQSSNDQAPITSDLLTHYGDNPAYFQD